MKSEKELNQENNKFDFHQDTEFRIIFTDDSKSNLYKISVNYRGNKGNGNTIYTYKTIQPFHEMICDIVNATNHTVNDIKIVEINGQQKNIDYRTFPTQMENPAPFQQIECSQLTEFLYYWTTDPDEFRSAALGEIDFNGCVKYGWAE